MTKKGMVNNAPRSPFAIEYFDRRRSGDFRPGSSCNIEKMMLHKRTRRQFKNHHITHHKRTRIMPNENQQVAETFVSAEAFAETLLAKPWAYTPEVRERRWRAKAAVI